MVSTSWSRFLRVRITAAYAVILICVTTTMSNLGPQAQEWVLRHASTNLHNLSHGRMMTLLDSAFVVDAGLVYEWLPGLVCLLGLAELLWRSGRLVVAFAVGHIGATNTGHAVALILGMLVTTRFGTPRPWTSARVILLLVASAFGYLVLASTEPLFATAGAGAIGASLGSAVALCRYLPFPSRRRSSRTQGDAATPLGERSAEFVCGGLDPVGPP